MNCFEISLQPNTAKLSCYLQQLSDELPGCSVRPAVLILPGGGYKTCSDREAEPVALAYLHAGYNAFVLRYTTMGHDNARPAADIFPMAFADAQAAMLYLHEQAETLHIDLKRIVAVGFSAGGNLAAALGTLAECKPAALVLGYASVDDDIAKSLGVAEPVMIDSVSAQTPPSFLFTTQADSLVPSTNTLRFSLALAERKIPYEVHVFATGDHGLSLAEEHTGMAEPDVAQWFPMSLRFLRNLWSGKNLVWSSAEQSGFSANTRLDVLLANPAAKAILASKMPALIPLLEQNKIAVGLSLRRLAALSHDKIPAALVEEIDRALAEQH